MYICIFDHLIVDHFQHLPCSVFAVFYQAQLESRNEAGNKHFFGGFGLEQSRLVWPLLSFAGLPWLEPWNLMKPVMNLIYKVYISGRLHEDCGSQGYIFLLRELSWAHSGKHNIYIITSSNSSWFPCHVPGAESMETGCRAEPDITGDTGPGILRLRPLRWPETPPAAVWYLTILYPMILYLEISDDVALWTQVACWYCLPSWGPEKRAVSRGRQVSVCQYVSINSWIHKLNRTGRNMLYLANIVQRYNYKK